MTQELQFRILIDEVVANYDKYDANRLAEAKRQIIGKLQLKQFPKVSAAKAIENIIDKLMELSKALAVMPETIADCGYCNWFTQINSDLIPVVKEYQKLFAQELLKLKDNGTEN